MRPFVPELPQINPRWISTWGKKLGIENIAPAMLSNERVSKRVHLDILREMEIDTAERFDDDTVIAATQYLEDREKLVTLCGLVMHVDHLRERITKEDFGEIAKMFDVGLLKAAVSLAELQGAKQYFNTDESRFAEVVQRSGRACLAAWKAGLDTQMAIRLELADSEDDSEEEFAVLPDVTVASRIVVEASRRLIEASVNQLS